MLMPTASEVTTQKDFGKEHTIRCVCVRDYRHP